MKGEVRHTLHDWVTDLQGTSFESAVRMQPARKSRLAVCEISTYRWTFEEDVFRYRQLGFDSIGIWRYKLNEFGEEKAVELLTENQMSVSSLHWAGGFTGGDGRTFRESMFDALDAIDVAANLNAGCLVILTGSRGGHTRNHARRILTKALTELGEAAMAKNIQLAVEPMHVGCAHDWTFLTELPATLDIISEIGNPNVGIVFDCYHMAHDPNVVYWLPEIVPSIRLVQMGDSKATPMGEQNRCMLGEGSLPLPEIVRTLEANDYQGVYEIELLGEDIEHIEYRDILDQAGSTLRGWLMPVS